MELEAKTLVGQQKTKGWVSQKRPLLNGRSSGRGGDWGWVQNSIQVKKASFEAVPPFFIHCHYMFTQGMRNRDTEKRRIKNHQISCMNQTVFEHKDSMLC